MRRPPPTEIARARRRAAAGRPRRLAVRAQPPPRGGSRPSGRRGRREVGRRERPSWPRGRRLPPAPRRPHDREAGRRTQRAWQALRQHDCPERRARIRAAETREGVENGELLTQRLLDAEAGEAPPQRLERRDRRLQRTRDNLGTDGLDIRRPRLLDRFEQIVVRKRRHGRRGRRSRRLRGEAGCHPAAFGEQVELVRRRFPVRTQGAGLRPRGAGVRWLRHRAQARMRGPNTRCLPCGPRAGAPAMLLRNVAPGNIAGAADRRLSHFVRYRPA